MTGAVILAAGKGERLGNVDKAFLSLGPKPVVAYSLLAFESCPHIDYIVLVVRKERLEGSRGLARLFGISKLMKIVAGGNRRQDSVKAGLNALPTEARMVVIHDAARPLVTPELISLCVASARTKGTGIAAHRMVDTVKECDKNLKVTQTIDREKLWAVQTPQAFSAELLRRAMQKVTASRSTITDDAGAVELLGEPVHLVEWQKPNIKLTVPDDLALVSALLSKN